jgi:hypothetical protein
MNVLWIHCLIINIMLNSRCKQLGKEKSFSWASIEYRENGLKDGSIPLRILVVLEKPQIMEPTVYDIENSGCHDINIINDSLTLVLICNTESQASSLYEFLKDAHKHETQINQQGFPVVRISFKNGIRLNIPVHYLTKDDPIVGLLNSGKINKITSGIFDSNKKDQVHSFQPDLPIRTADRTN